MNCPCCNQQLHVYLQPALMQGRPARELAECLNKSCVRYAITLSPASLMALTDEDVMRYGQPQTAGAR